MLRLITVETNFSQECITSSEQQAGEMMDLSHKQKTYWAFFTHLLIKCMIIASISLFDFQ
jgi:hypothetical protein